ncbi:MAG TPA: glycosyltransferase [Anaerolineales bacterium]|nr:glycosyltransferase [Anaerolineales bacterium]
MSQSNYVSPKALIVDLSNFYGGASSRVLSLMTNAQPGTIGLAGLHAGVITTKARQLGLPVHAVAGHKADPRLLFKLMRVIRQEGYNLLDSQNIQSKFWANLAAMFTGTALVSTLNSWYIHEHSKNIFKGQFYQSLEFLTNQTLALYITVSDRDRQLLLKTGIPGDAIDLVYNAIELDVDSIPADKDALKKQFDLPPRAIVGTCVGRLVPQKGFDILIEAFQRIASQVPDLYCLIIGEGDDKDELTRQIQTAGLEKRVRLVGYYDRQNVLSILKSSDMFVMPSRYEGTPVALLEAAALACPILATCAGGIPEMVTHDQHAYLVPTLDSESLAQGFVKMTLDREYAQTLGRNAQRRVRETFSPKYQIDATRASYEKALRRHQVRKK